MGTANNIATTLGLTNKTIHQVIAGWTAGRQVNFDAGVASGPWDSKWFIEGIGVGLFTETMYRLDKTNNADLAHLEDNGEKVTSVLQILKDRLPGFTPNRLKVTLDGRDMSGDYVLLEVMNISYIGPNLCLAPHANPSDGLLDIVLVSKDEQDNLSSCLSHCIEGRLPNRVSPCVKVSTYKSSGRGLLCTLMTRCGRIKVRLFPFHPTSLMSRL